MTCDVCGSEKKTLLTSSKCVGCEIWWAYTEVPREEIEKEYERDAFLWVTATRDRTELDRMRPSAASVFRVRRLLTEDEYEPIPFKGAPGWFDFEAILVGWED